MYELTARLQQVQQEQADATAAAEGAAAAEAQMKSLSRELVEAQVRFGQAQGVSVAGKLVPFLTLFRAP